MGNLVKVVETDVPGKLIIIGFVPYNSDTTVYETVREENGKVIDAEVDT